MVNELIIYVADAGSVSKKNFHWVCSRDISASSSDPEELARSVAGDLAHQIPVALGYECPLFMPVEIEKGLLGRARKGECEAATGNRSFSAGAGASILATGVPSLAWVLRKIKELNPNVSATTRWSDFKNGKHKLFVWEAFVTGSEKAFPPSHVGDARLAISAFQQEYSKADIPTRVTCTSAFSLAGTAIIWAELSGDLSLLFEPCVVVRPIFSEAESKKRILDFKLRQAESRILKAKKAALKNKPKKATRKGKPKGPKYGE